MDKEIIFLIIIFLFSLISNLLNKKKKQQQRKKTGGYGSDEPSRPQKKPFSFEDILKEFETEVLDKPQQQSTERMPYGEEPQYRKRALEESDSVRPLEEKERYMDKAPTVEEKFGKYESFEGTSYETVSDDEIKMPENLGVSKRDEHYEVESRQSNRFADMLKNSDGLKDAIVLNEILNRKY